MQLEPPNAPYSCSTIAKVLYIRDATYADRELSVLTEGPLGFDIEWRPKFVKGGPDNPVALIQLATVDTVFLLQISAMQGT